MLYADMPDYYLVLYSVMPLQHFSRQCNFELFTLGRIAALYVRRYGLLLQTE